MTLRAVIMAGGEGTRLRPFTRTIPKPLLPIGRKPVAQIIVERLRDCGIQDIVMSLEYGAELIRAFFQDGRQFGVRISYFQEPRKLGTAGCLAHLPDLDERSFLVTNGDVITNLDYRAFMESHDQSEAVMTVATRFERTTIPYGVLTLEGDRVRVVEEKPTLQYVFNAGIYTLSPHALKFVPKDRPFDMTDLITSIVASDGIVRSCPIDGLWFDLAKVDDFEKALTQLEATNPELL